MQHNCQSQNQSAISNIPSAHLDAVLPQVLVAAERPPTETPLCSSICAVHAVIATLRFAT